MKKLTVGDLKAILNTFDDNDVVCVEEWDDGTSLVTSLGKIDGKTCYEETNALVLCTNEDDDVNKLCCNAVDILWTGFDNEGVSSEEN